MIVAPLRLMAGLLTVLALVLLLEWTVPGNADTAAPAAALHVLRGSPKITLATRAAGNWAAAVLDRPLFSISRRPPKVTAGPSEAAPDEARLAGILIGRFGKQAIFAPEGGGKPLVLGEGAAINESVIRSIQPSQVVLASGAVLTPSFDKNRTPSAPFIPGFQPPAPGFQPNFPNGMMPQPGFPMQRSVMPPPQAETNDGAPPPGVPVPGMTQPVPVFRGPMPIPQRRE
jgi:hypothetical protein